MYPTANDLMFGNDNSNTALNALLQNKMAQSPMDMWSGVRNPTMNSFGGLGGFDMGKLALGGLQTIGSLWSAWEANKLAKQQLAYQKEFAEANLTNQIASYNTALEDRSRSRAAQEGQTAAEAASYIDRNRLTR